jgi:hypothetical protein
MGFLRWIWEFPGRHRPCLLAALEAARRDGKSVHHLTSRRDVDAFIASLGSATA